MFNDANIPMKFSNRNSSFELLRICCMLMIIAGHIIIVHQTRFDLQSWDFGMDLFLQGAFAVAVNVFVLISGFWGIKFKWQRFLKLDIQTLYYSVTLLILAAMLGWHSIDVKKDFLFLFPILSKQYWFITCYAVLYLISPLLNHWAKSLEKGKYGRLLWGGFFLVYVWSTISFLFNAAQFVNDAGYGIINFIYLYMLGRYLHYHYIERYSVKRYLSGYICSVVLLFCVQYGLSYSLGFEFTALMSYNTIFVFWGSVFLFLMFKNMHFSSSWVNLFAKPCLAVYLLHMHPYIWYNFVEIINVRSFCGWHYLLLIVLAPITIYMVCAVIESIRVMLFGKIEDFLLICIENGKMMRRSNIKKNYG